MKVFNLHVNAQQKTSTVKEALNTQAEWLGQLVKGSICHWPPWYWHNECVNQVAMGTNMEALHVCQFVKTGPVTAAVEWSLEADKNFGDELRIRTLNKHPGLLIILIFSLF